MFFHYSSRDNFSLHGYLPFPRPYKLWGHGEATSGKSARHNNRAGPLFFYIFYLLSITTFCHLSCHRKKGLMGGKPFEMFQIMVRGRFAPTKSAPPTAPGSSATKS